MEEEKELLKYVMELKIYPDRYNAQNEESQELQFMTSATITHQ